MHTLMRYINRVWRCAVLYRSDKLEYEGLNGYQHSYIMRICQNPGLSQDQLAKTIYINKSNVTRQLALLEQNGFVTRKPASKDKRVMEVFPTEKALDVYPQVKALAMEWDDYLLSDFSAEERRLLFLMLERVADKAARAVEQEAGEEENACAKY